MMRHARGFLGAAILLAAGTTGISPGQQSDTSNRLSDSLKTYLRSYLSLESKSPPDATTKVSVFTVKKNNRYSEEKIVYLSGAEWCGSGGCTMLIIEPTKSTFRVIGRITIVQLPIRLLPSVNHAHPDISVTVRGGGIRSAYEAVLSYKGTRYPDNPSILPAQKTAILGSKVIIESTDDSVALYN